MKFIIDLIQSLIEDFDIRGRRLFMGGLVFVAIIGAFWLESVWHVVYYHNLSTRVSLLEQINALAAEGVQDKPELRGIYYQMVEELSSIDNAAITLSLPQQETDPSTQLWKALSASSIWIIAVIISLFSKFPTSSDRFSVVVVLFVFALITAAIGWLVPIFYSPWINYIGLPVVQIALLARMALKR